MRSTMIARCCIWIWTFCTKHEKRGCVEKGFSCLVLGVTLSCVERRGDGSERGTLPNRGRRDVYGTL